MTARPQGLDTSRRLPFALTRHTIPAIPPTQFEAHLGPPAVSPLSAFTMAAVRRSSSTHSLLPDASVLDYARYHGICRHHGAENPLDHRHLPQAPIFLSQDLADPTGSSRLRLPPELDTSERLDIDFAAVTELKAIAALSQSSQTAEQFAHPHRRRAFKVEPPLLRTEHEIDVLGFRRRACLRLQDVKLPLEHADEEKDEGISWPTWAQQLPSKFEKEVASDRLQIPKDAMLYLHSVCVQPPRPEIPEPTLTKRKMAEPVTPPLLPSDPVLTQVPDPSSSSPTGRVQLLSEATNSTAAEAEALEAKILQQDRIGTPDGPGLKHFIEDPMLFDEIEDVEMEESAPPVRSRRHAAELKVEAPLTPPSTLPSAFRSSAKGTKSVSFPDEMLEYIPHTAELPSKYENGNDVLDSENDFDAFFQEYVAPIAEKADRQVEHEQLQEVDTTKRVKVPCIDFEVLTAPWDEYGLKPSLKRDGIATQLGAQRRLLSRCMLEELTVAPKWRESMKQQMGMLWNPLPTDLPKFSLTESIEDDMTLNQVIGSSFLKDVDIVESGSLAWKLEGLRILDDAQDAEEISAWQFEPGNDMASLLQKRRLEIADNEEKQLPVPASKALPVPASGKKQKLNGSEPHKPLNNGDFMFGGLFSTSVSVAQFMHVHTGAALPEKIYKTAEQTDTANQPEHTSRKDIEMQDEPANPDAEAKDTTNIRPLPSLPIPGDLPPKPFIISTSLLTRRRDLVRQIQTLYPSAKLIERDTDKPLSTTTRPSPSDPDIMLSPASGLLITTLQRIKQRPLPGQQTSASALSTFQTHIAQCSRKFAHLLVLVSESSSSPPRALDASDCDALATLNGFASTLRSGGAGVTVAYVPGGEDALARWVVGAMAEYGRDEGELLAGGVLHEEEGLWELFLRRAGMNAFAAQVVLAKLKEGEVRRMRGEGVRGFGLVEFVRMGERERREAFAEVVGGGEGLGDVGERVERVWARARVG